jgi:hypothetical protein
LHHKYASGVQGCLCNIQAKTLRNHRELILNYFRAKKHFSSGVVEGLNNKAKVTMRKSYGFRTFRITEISLYHALGKLPEPKLPHKFLLTKQKIKHLGQSSGWPFCILWLLVPQRAATGRNCNRLDHRRRSDADPPPPGDKIWRGAWMFTS